MSQHPISGDLSLEDIAGTIQSVEVTRNKFVGATIQGKDNLCDFIRQRVPPRAQLILAGKPAPPGTTLSWSGTLRVSGKEAKVELYRGASATGPASGDLGAQIERVQSALALKVDGAAGPKTWEAIAEALDLPAITQVELPNARSKAVIATLLPEVHPYARALYFKARERGITISLLSGTRSFAEQDALYAIGRKNGKVVGKIVTKAKAGYSNHNFGIAFDVGVFKGREYLKDPASYLALGVLGEEIGLEWGGRWKSFPDASHFQLRPAWAVGMTQAAMLARLRSENPDGISLPKHMATKIAVQAKLPKSCQC